MKKVKVFLISFIIGLFFCSSINATFTQYRLSSFSAFGVIHAISSYHTVGPLLHNYKIKAGGFDPFTAYSRVKTVKNNGIGGYYEMKYKWKDWVGLPHDCVQRQEGIAPLGFTKYYRSVK